MCLISCLLVFYCLLLDLWFFADSAVPSSALQAASSSTAGAARPEPLGDRAKVNSLYMVKCVSEYLSKSVVWEKVVVMPQKTLRDPSDSSHGKTLSIRGTSCGEHFHHTTLRLDPHFVLK